MLRGKTFWAVRWRELQAIWKQGLSHRAAVRREDALLCWGVP